MCRILRCSNYFEVLEVGEGASQEEITRNYRSWALRVHPDKNPAKNADTAAKSMGTIFRYQKFFGLVYSDQSFASALILLYMWSI